VDKLCAMFGIKATNCQRLVIDIQVGELVKAYANVIGDFDKPYGEAIAEVLGTAAAWAVSTEVPS